jgi:hypothetical protein
MPRKHYQNTVFRVNDSSESEEDYTNEIDAVQGSAVSDMSSESDTAQGVSYVS